MGPADVQSLIDLFSFIGETVQALEKGDAFGSGMLPPAQALKAWALAANFQRDPDLDLASRGLAFVNLPACANSWGVLFRILFKVRLGPIGAEELAQLERVLEHHPEGTLIYFYAQLASNLLDTRKEPAEQLRQMRRVAQLFQRAAESGCLFPKFARHARFWAAWAQSILSHPKDQPPDLAMRARARDNMRWLLHYGSLKVNECDLLAGFALRYLKDPVLAGWLVDEGQIQDPENLQLLQQRLRIEFALEPHFRALEVADLVLKRKPDDKEALRYRQAVADKLRGQTPAVPVKP